ncbi:MAG: NADH-quinone oxidoreductase subunit C [Alphaproteobacteria bacterium]|nr:MAG: NADH-quinone oxidoreductase subunit C [Alphaproteobacteria bacterium]
MPSPAPLGQPRPGIIEAVKAAIGSAFLSAKDEVGEVSIDVARESIADVLRMLRDALDYQQLMEIAGVDYPERAERFEVVYHLLSVTKNHRIRIRVSTDEEQPVPTVTDIFPVAGWLEREVFDMYGVIFAGNRDLRRILTDYGFRGHPQRKDFPLTGFVELRYSEEAKRVVYEPVSLSQDFRNFDFMSPWEGAEYIIPGDEKAQGEAPGAPTPLTSAEINKAAAPKAEPPAPTPKTTDAKAETGAGEPADKQAAKHSPRKKAPPAPTEPSGKTR